MSRLLEIITPLGEGNVFIKTLSGNETLGQIPSYQLMLVARRGDVKPNELLGKNVTIGIEMPVGMKTRYINGYITNFADAGETKESYFQQNGYGKAYLYHVEVQPGLWFLTQTRDCRIFQNLTVPEIIKKIVEKYPLFSLEMKQLRAPKGHVKLEYCCQYRESDYNFIHRLMVQEGIYYYFEYENGKHTMVLCDDTLSHLPKEGYEEILYLDADDAGKTESEFISDWHSSYQAVTGNYITKDFNFEIPHHPLTGAKSSPDMHEMDRFKIFDYPGKFNTHDNAQHYAEIRMQDLYSQFERSHARGSVRGIQAGHRFRLLDHPRAEFNRDYLVINSKYTIKNNSLGSGGEAGEFMCHFEVQPARIFFRQSEDGVSKPTISGPQTAFVVGPKDEEIYTDEYGRVKVKFHWDRYSTADEQSSCFVRVAQTSAGNGWGAMQIPRVGHEVIVEFLHGNPDCPIITGSVYNGQAARPWHLPDHKTQSGIKTRSYKGGMDNFNELRFENKKGEEHIYQHAERDHILHTKNSRYETIGNQSHLIVKKDHLEELHADFHHTVAGDDNSKVNGMLSLIVQEDWQVKINGKTAIQTGSEGHFKAGSKVVLEAGAQLTLKVGGNFVTVNSSGVFINGSTVNMGTGGSAGTANHAFPKVAQIPVAQALAKQFEKVFKKLDKHKLTSRFALEQMMQLAKNAAPNEFVAFVVPIFGFDIPAEAYIKLHNSLKNGAIPNAEIVVTDNPDDFPARFNNADRKIYVNDLAAQNAAESPEDSWKLMMILVHEFGHYLDAIIRQNLLDKSEHHHDDAEGEEGAKFAYHIVKLDYLNSTNVVYAHYSSPKITTDLKVDYAEASKLIQKAQGSNAQNRSKIEGRFEYFGAGDGEHYETKPGHSFGHRSIEKALETAGFQAPERNMIYFGNWLRDFSQVVDPAVTRKESEAPDFPRVLTRKGLTNLVKIKAELEFGRLSKNAELPTAQGQAKPASSTTPSAKEMAKDLHKAISELDVTQTSKEVIEELKDVSSKIDYEKVSRESADKLKELTGKLNTKGIAADKLAPLNTAVRRLDYEAAITEFIQENQATNMTGNHFAPNANHLSGANTGGYDDISAAIAKGKEILKHKNTETSDAPLVDSDPTLGNKLGTGNYGVFEVNTETLGVYRYFEHIDNPKNFKPDDPRGIDADFLAPVPPGSPILDVDPQRSMKRYILHSVAYMEQQLQLAVQKGRTHDGMRHFGAALHVLEDYFAHSNFVELSLRKVGYSNVLVWTSTPAGHTRPPVVTGMFNPEDAVASVSGLIAELLFPVQWKFVPTKPGERTPADRAILIILSEMKYPFALEQYENYLALRDRLDESIIGQGLQRVLHYTVGMIRNLSNVLLNSLVHLIGNSVDDIQVLLDNPNTSGSTDPTHSQLAKDHDNHHFHVLAAQLAMDAVEKVGIEMANVWKGKGGNPAKVARDYIVHPDHTNWMDEKVKEWAEANLDKVKLGESENEWVAHEKELRETMKKTWGYINENFEVLFGKPNKVEK